MGPAADVERHPGDDDDDRDDDGDDDDDDEEEEEEGEGEEEENNLIITCWKWVKRSYVCRSIKSSYTNL